LAQLTNYDPPSGPEFGLDNTPGGETFLYSIQESTIVDHSTYYLTLQNQPLGDTWNIYGVFAGYGLGSHPSSGTITEIDRANGFKLKNLNFDFNELFAPPGLVTNQKILSHMFAGDDSITADGAAVNNNIMGYDGDDTIDASAATQNDTLFGGAGSDAIYGGIGFNRVNGNTGDDTILGFSRTGDWLSGGQGADSINASHSAGHNIVNGNLGNDTIQGGSGGDTLHGGKDDDVIVGGAGRDWISGDLGANTLTGGEGADTFHAGAGHDLVTDFNQAQGDRVAIDAGVTYHASQAGADVHIDLANGGQMVLQNTQLSSLGASSGWIVIG
jgi:Ca2+-binding RTX toxin-like protein